MGHHKFSDIVGPIDPERSARIDAIKQQAQAGAAAPGRVVNESEFPNLSTERLILRELTTKDSERVFEIHGNAKEMKLFGNDPMAHQQRAVEFIDRLTADRSSARAHLRWALVDRAKPNSPLHGTCGLFGWTPHNKACKIGYELHHEVHGQGLMSEAISSVLDWAFLHRDLNRVVADIHPDNAASRKLAKRHGFQAEGIQREAGFWGGKHHDLILYSLLRSER